MEIKASGVSPQLKAAVCDLYDDYADAVDTEDLDRWVGFFSDDASYRVIARESHSLGLTHATIYCDGIGMIRDRATMLTKVAVFEPRVLRHFITGVRIHSASADTIVASANFQKDLEFRRP